jgi:hypothetical protein
MKHSQPFTSWVQDAGEALQTLLADILAGRIDESDIPEAARCDLQSFCEDIVAIDASARKAIAEKQAEAFFERCPNHDPHAGLRHSQDERL